MEKIRREKLLDFYRRELKENILPFWLQKGIDTQNGGFLNCYDNEGLNLISRNKYTWSQGRFVWMFAKLARMPLFSEEERAFFLGQAAQGAAFLKEHALMAEPPLRCVFLMDEKGTPLYLPGETRLDAGTTADYFAILGFNQYALAGGGAEWYRLALELYTSMKQRVADGTGGEAPYPTPAAYKAHSQVMIFTNLATELCTGAKVFAPQEVAALQKDIAACLKQTFEAFTDARAVLHEYIRKDGVKDDSLLCRVQKPGHAIEDMWFALDAMELLGDESYVRQAAEVSKKAFANGWDADLGGITLFADEAGGEPQGTSEGMEGEHMVRHIRESWSDKVWWTHSEALYCALRFYIKTGDKVFLELYERTEAVTFEHFPDRVNGEWIQIRTRDFTPCQKVVALPVKDPYHITRNFAYIIELLEREEY